MSKIARALKNIVAYPYYKDCLTGIRRRLFPIFVEYPVYPQPRYGYNGQEPHQRLSQILENGRETYRSQLESFKSLEAELLRIQTSAADDGEEPYWENAWFKNLDAVALYGYLATRKPKIHLEIGSGNSTKFARRAIRDQHLDTRIISIDPHPRAEIDALADEVIRQPLETLDLAVFDRLTRDDLLFFDGSHRCFMNSDVTVFFLEVLPRLPAGILIHIHDIYLPYDYPPSRALRYESEQYLIAAMLLGGCTQYETLLPVSFVAHDERLTGILDSLWNSPNVKIARDGGSFWMRKLTR
jgi:hypothetical protein